MVETEHVNMMNYHTPYHEGSGNACSVQNHMDYWKYKGLERTECAFEEQQQMALCPKGKRSLLDRPPYWHESPFFQPHTELPLRDEDSSPRYAEYFLDHKPPIIACYSRKKKKIIKSKEILSSEQCTSSFTFPQVALGGSVVQSPKRIERKKRPMTLLSADADDRGEYKAGHMILRKTASRIKRSARARRLRNSALSKAKAFNHAALTSKTRRCLHVKASKQSECHLKEQIDDRVHEYVQRNAYKSRHNPDPECKRSRPVRRMALRAQTNISYMLKSETNEHCIKPGAKPKRKKHRPKVQKEFFSPIPKTTPCNARENSISKVYFHLTRAKKTQKKSGRKKHLKTSPSKNRKRTQSQVGDLLGTGAFCVVNGCPEILNIIPANDLPGIKRIKDTLLLCLHGHPKSPISSVAEPSSASNEISQKISGKCRELALASNQELPASVRSNTQIVLYDQRRDTVLFKVPKKFKLVQPKVPISDENERIWPLLALGGIPADYEDQQYWEKERILMKERVTDFIWRMQEVQGDRRFSPWKGSVLDSVVGAFLTQNVQDHLSSSAFMCIASRFPAKHRNHENEAVMGCPSQRESDSRTDFLIEKEIDFTVDYSGKTVKKQSRFHSITTAPKWSKKRNLSHISGIERARIEENLNGWKKNCSHDWESIRKKIMSNPSKDDMTLHENAVDWEAVRHCDVGDLAMAIKERGMHHVLSGRIKAFLKALEEEHGSIDLEWLRELSPENARAYLMSIHGLNVKSTECIRLLTLHHVAFPVDVHVGRICVRLGWVPIEPLPDQMQLHLLELYPLQETVQKYLWPRLCTLDQKTLYEFHYQLITFGKVFCTKSRPNCNACPMQRECKHFGSAYASAKLLLTGSLEEDETLQKESSHYGGYGVTSMNSPSIDGEFVANSYCPVIALDYFHDNQQDQSEDLFDLEDFTFIHEEYHVPFDTRPSQLEHFSEPCYLVNSEAEKDNHLNYPSYSVHDNGYHTQGFSIRDHSISSTPRSDCESSFCDRDYIKVPTSRRKLVFGEQTENSIISYQNRRPLHVPQLKKTSRLCTVHYVYEIPDMHPILDEVEPRRKDDPSSYLLAIWSPDEVPHSMIELEGHCSSSPPRSRSTDETVPGTLLIPCKTALRGSFPLNGTYFQVNEVFADHKSSLEPLKVPRSLIWELNRCLVYFGTSLSQIVRGFTRDEIKECFSNGYVCVRGFDRQTRCPKPLVCRLHLCQSREQNKRNANSENS